MRSTLAVALGLVLAGTAAAEIGLASVELTSSASVNPGQTQTFRFWIQNSSSDGESIADVIVSFPDGYVLAPATMTYAPLPADPSRPAWTMRVPVAGHTAQWLDTDGGTGELHAEEGTEVVIDVKAADQLYDIPVFWCLQGDAAGAMPHRLCGCIELIASPVEGTSWTSIKALYR